jgi:hypothetical protein
MIADCLVEKFPAARAELFRILRALSDDPEFASRAASRDGYRSLLRGDDETERTRSSQSSGRKDHPRFLES